MLAYIIFIILLIKVIFNGNKLSNYPEKNTKCPQIFLYNLRLKLFLNSNFKIIITKYILKIITTLAKIKSFNSQNNISNIIIVFY